MTPTLNSHTHFQAVSSIRTSQNLSKSVSETVQRKRKIKHESTTRYIMHGFLTSDTTPYKDRYLQYEKKLSKSIRFQMDLIALKNDNDSLYNLL